MKENSAEPSTDENNGDDDLMTYDQISKALGIPYTSLSQAAWRFKADPAFPQPRKVVGRRNLFAPEQVDDIRKFLAERSFTLAIENGGPSIDFEELMKRTGLTKAGVWYYRRRYGLLFPDFFQREGRARPQARFLVATVEEFEQWIAAGKPEDEDLQIASIGRLSDIELIVNFKNGVAVALSGDENRIAPAMDEEAARKYIDCARKKLSTWNGK